MGSLVQCSVERVVVRRRGRPSVGWVEGWIVL